VVAIRRLEFRGAGERKVESFAGWDTALANQVADQIKTLLLKFVLESSIIKVRLAFLAVA